LPAIIDHDQRREDVAEVAARLIARHGIEALTIRGVAKAAGFSTAVVSHYFSNKRELLLFTYRFVGERARAMVRPTGGWTAQSLRQCYLEMLPLNAESLENWRIWFAFWGVAASDADFAREQRDQMRTSRELNAQRLVEGLGVSGPEARRMSRLHLIMMMGLAVEICFDVENVFSEDDVRPLVDAIFTTISPALGKPRLQRRA
jgi:AcrR family transcriptional regulator